MSRNPKTGKSERVGNIKYDDWYNKYVESNPEALFKEKAWKNRHGDRKQYEDYINAIGRKNMPRSFAKFQEIKYNDNNKWELIKDYKKSVTSGRLSPLADFKLYETTSKEIKAKLIGAVTPNKIKIKGHSKHLIDRVIGSVEEKRNGVPVDKILDALLKSDEIRPIVENKNGRSQRFIKEKTCIVSVNPDTGVIIQVNPLSRGKKK